MQECPVGLQQKHIEQIAHLEAEVDNLKDVVGSLSIIKDAVVQLTTLQKEQVENNKEFKTAIKELAASNIEFRSTLKQVSDNLTNLSSDVTGLQCQFLEAENRNKIDQRDVVNGLLNKALSIGGFVSLALIAIYEILKATGVIK